MKRAWVASARAALSWVAEAQSDWGSIVEADRVAEVDRVSIERASVPAAEVRGRVNPDGTLTSSGRYAPPEAFDLKNMSTEQLHARLGLLRLDDDAELEAHPFDALADDLLRQRDEHTQKTGETSGTFEASVSLPGEVRAIRATEPFEVGEPDGVPVYDLVDDDNPRRHEWSQLRACGLLYMANTVLHAFGWAIVVTDDGDAYPARTSWRGFPEETQARAHRDIATYMQIAAPALVAEAYAEEPF